MRISILGLGLMGSSLGLTIRKAIPAVHVVGYDASADETGIALRRGCIHEPRADIPAAVADADLIVLAAPVGALPAMMTAAADHLPPTALVTDLASTKRSVIAAAHRHLPRSTAFVASHPMVGAETSGADHARPDLYPGGLTILIVEPDTHAAAASRLEQFWQQLGMRTTRLTAADHDRLVAAISHLPHALAAALVRMQEPASLRIAGRGFRDLTRVAAGQPVLWRDILIDNAENLRAATKQLRAELDRLDRLLDPKHAHELEEWLGAAASARRALDAPAPQSPRPKKQ